MASLQQKGGSFYCQFCYHGKRHTVTVGPVSREEADAFAGKVEYLLLRIRQRLIHVPPGVAISDFILQDGKVAEPEAPPVEPIAFRQLRDRYLETHENGALEENSLDTVKMHLRHLEHTLGEGFPVQELSLADLQRHVNLRARKKYRGKLLSPVTLKKEMASFRAAWNWAAHTGLVKGAFPSKGLVYPKTDEKPPFMTWQEIERRVQAGGLTEAQVADLWDALYLRKEEVDQLLKYVKSHAAYPWIYPLICAAAYTGARRSELLRAEVADIDFEADMTLIREKKRSRKQRTTRHVSLTPFLKGVLQDWLAVHPGGKYLFCHAGEVPRSKKRSRTTGHLGAKTRPSSLKGRMAAVRRRGGPGIAAITRDEAHDHFKRTLAASKWEVLRGFHVLRHSFISCLSAAGVDQRIIDEFVGHQTDEQRRRYRHLVPDVKQKAIAGVFG
jgi:integrase